MLIGVIGDDFTGSSDIANNLKKAGMSVGMYSGVPDNKMKLNKYDAVVAIGCIIKGKTDHYEFISNAITKTLLELSIQKKLPISNSVLTCKNIKQAKERSSKKLNRAKEAVEAAIAVLQD